MLKKSGERRHLCLPSDLGGEALSFSSLMILVAVFYRYYLFKNATLLFLVYSKFLSQVIDGFYEMLLKKSIDVIIWFFLFSLLRWWFIYIFLMLNQTCTDGINPTWLWCIILFIHCWVCFADILFRIFAAIFMRDIDP